LAGRGGKRKSAVAKIGDAIAFQFEHECAFRNGGYSKMLEGTGASNNTQERLRRKNDERFAES
jgi:hypothetical protein